MRRKRRTAIALGAAVVLAGCAGPHTPLSVGVLQLGSNIEFGAAAIQAAPPLPPGGLTVAPPSVGAPLVVAAGRPPAAPTSPTSPVAVGPGPARTVPAPPDSCPAASPFAVPLLSPTNTIAAPPRPGTYSYRNQGTYETSGAHPQKLAYPAVSTRTVSDVTTTTSGFSYQVQNTTGGLVTTTGYQYIAADPTSQAATSATPTSGLYITRISERRGSTVIDNFNAAGPGLLLMQAPFVPGAAWTTSAADPTTGATITAGVQEVGHDLVDACGQVVAAVTVRMNGSIGIAESVQGQPVTASVPGQAAGASNVEPASNTDTTFVADYSIATQYGGLSVMDDLDETGTQAGTSAHSTDTSTIDSVPVAP